MSFEMNVDAMYGRCHGRKGISESVKELLGSAELAISAGCQPLCKTRLARL